MTVKPIIFSGPMVKALLADTKSQTRRIINPGNIYDDIASEAAEEMELRGWHVFRAAHDGLCAAKLPYAPGDLLYVRESFATHPCAEDTVYKKGDGHPWGSPIYKATFGAALAPVCEGFTKWKPSIHMPRWASRLTLEVTDVRVQRLQDISEEDARAEGCPGWYSPCHPDFGSTDGRMPHEEFADLWNSLHGEGAWQANPWVAAYTFTVHRCNVDDLLRQREAA